MDKKSLTDDLKRLRASQDFFPEELPEPTPLEELTGEEPAPFPGGVLPEVLEAFLKPFSEQLGIRYDVPAMTALGLASGLLAGRYKVRPDPRNPTWGEGINLWVAIIAPTGNKKTPVLKALAEPLYELEQAFHEEFEAKRRIWELEREAWKAKKPEERGPEPKEPKPWQVVVEDTTKEALVRALQVNRGLVAVFDELTSLFATWQMVNRVADRAFWLKAYSGGYHREDRMSRETTLLREPALAVVGFVQPGPFRQIVLKALEEGEGADGLLQRFILVQGGLTPWPEERPMIESQVYHAYQVFMKGLWREPQAPPVALTFDPEAQKLWYEWEDEVEREIRNEDLPEAWRGYLGKRLGLTARLAGVLSVLWGEKGVISEDSLLRAISLVEWAETHAKRVWRRARIGDVSTLTRVASKLLERARQGSLPKEITARWLVRQGFAGLETSREASKVLSALEREGWLLRVPNPRTATWALNPRLLTKAQA
ncbi:hypothetical protein Theos_2082 [Thermus oshimai JL-2]|uniref:DUF3987 domain-containing protein n=1 Tax=Thermus oshimai JL-2 TaxID=751945 RepID=K7R7S8_THEOS|nr:hypothetical protein Theos_2082 [Thermus oshimai JL-2]